MEFFWIIVEVLSTAFENYVVLETLEKMFGHKYSGPKKYICLYSALVLSTGYVTLINQYNYFEGWLALITILFFVTYSALFIESKKIIKLLLPIILFSVIFGINVITAYIMSMVLGMPDTFFYYSKDSARLLGLFLTKFLFFITTRFFIRMHKKEPFELKKNESLVTIAIFILTLVISISLIMLQTNSRDSDALIFIAVFCALITNLFVFYMMKKISKDNKDKLKISILELQLSEQKNMIEEAGLISRDIKKTEHDLKHHLLSVLGMIEAGNMQYAENYLKSLLHEYEARIFKYISIDNSAVNSILNLKIGRCHANKIDIKVEIESSFFNFSDIDICVLLANLLDNAIEASRCVETPQISLSIKNKMNYLCITVRNRIDRSVLEKNKELKTTKRDKYNHGLGTFSISQIVEKYDGMKKYYEKNGYFVADIWLKQNIYSLEKRIETEAVYQTRQK